MKPLKSARSSSFSYDHDRSRVFLDHLERAILLMKDRGLEVTIADDEYEYESLAELRERGGIHPHRVKLLGKLPDAYATIEFSCVGPKFRITSYNADVFGQLPQQGVELFADARLRISNLLTPTKLALLAWFAWFPGVSLSEKLPLVSRWLLSIAAFLGLAAVASYAVRRTLTGVWLKRRHEGGFLKRNSDTIAVALPTGIITALATALITYLVIKLGIAH